MKSPRILIVDDREYDRILYKEYLGEINYTFVEMADGERIIEVLNQTQPDVVILDWQMPRVGGLEVLKLIKKNKVFENVPVIVITGLDKDVTLELAFDYGSVDFINKPVSKIELNKRVESVLRLAESTRNIVQQKQQLEELNALLVKQKEEMKGALELNTEYGKIKSEKYSNELLDLKAEVQANKLLMYKLLNQVKQARRKTQVILDTYGNISSGDRLENIKVIDKELKRIVKELEESSDYSRILVGMDPEFYSRLTALNPKLTPLEIRHCAYLKLNLSNHEIADILNVEVKSLQMSRYRIKKKLKIPGKRTLREVVLGL